MQCQDFISIGLVVLLQLATQCLAYITSWRAKRALTGKVDGKLCIAMLAHICYAGVYTEGGGGGGCTLEFSPPLG